MFGMDTFATFEKFGKAFLPAFNNVWEETVFTHNDLLFIMAQSIPLSAFPASTAPVI
jgi:hypothetical protein